MLENGAQKKQGATDQREQSLSGLRWMSEVGNFWNPPLAASETCSDHSNQGTCVSMPLGAKDWINTVETRGREFGGSYPMHHFGINSSIPLKPVLSVACFTLPIQLQVFHWRCHCMDQMHTKRNHWRQQNQAQPIWCAWPGHCTNIYDATPVGASRVSSCRYDQCPGHNPWISSSQVQNPSVVCNEPSCLGGFGSAQGIWTSSLCVLHLVIVDTNQCIFILFKYILIHINTIWITGRNMPEPRHQKNMCVFWGTCFKKNVHYWIMVAGNTWCHWWLKSCGLEPVRAAQLAALKQRGVDVVSACHSATVEAHPEPIAEQKCHKQPNLDQHQVQSHIDGSSCPAGKSNQSVDLDETDFFYLHIALTKLIWPNSSCSRSIHHICRYFDISYTRITCPMSTAPAPRYSPHF